MPSRALVILRRIPAVRLAAFAALLLVAGCHGSTLEAVYPGTLGHDPPPAVNLPPQDRGLEHL